MKKLRLIKTITLALALGLSMNFAVDASVPGSYQLTRITRDHSIGRPQSPDGQIVNVRYSNGDFIIEFLYPEGAAEVYVCTEDHTFERTMEIATTGVQVVPTEETSSAFFISITTDYGNTYAGVINL